MVEEAEHPAARDPSRLLAECEAKTLRRSGPGGQNRNKVETALVLKHGPTGASAEASERRSQIENKTVALFRLRVVLALDVRKPPGAVPNALWRSRVRAGRLSVAEEHPDFPALLAEALDHLGSVGMDVKAAAELLGVSTTQLVRFLKREPRALGKINAARAGVGLGPLR